MSAGNTATPPAADASLECRSVLSSDQLRHATTTRPMPARSLSTSLGMILEAGPARRPSCPGRPRARPTVRSAARPSAGGSEIQTIRPRRGGPAPARDADALAQGGSPSGTYGRLATTASPCSPHRGASRSACENATSSFSPSRPRWRAPPPGRLSSLAAHHSGGPLVSLRHRDGARPGAHLDNPALRAAASTPPRPAARSPAAVPALADRPRARAPVALAAEQVGHRRAFNPHGGGHRRETARAASPRRPASPGRYQKPAAVHPERVRKQHLGVKARALARRRPSERHERTSRARHGPLCVPVGRGASRPSVAGLTRRAGSDRRRARPRRAAPRRPIRPRAGRSRAVPRGSGPPSRCRRSRVPRRSCTR